MDDIFKKAKELVRQNPADFQEALLTIINNVFTDNHPLESKREIHDRFYNFWPDCRGKEVIVIGWLVSDTAIGSGEPSVPLALVKILTERLSYDDDHLNPANLQEWIRGMIFHQGESKQRLEDEVGAYIANETKNLLKDKSAISKKPASFQENIGIKEKNKGILKKIPYWIYILTLFFAALLTCLYYLGWLEPIKAFIYRIVIHK